MRVAWWPGPTLARAAVRLVALTLLLVSLFPIAASSSSRALAAGCAGDEQIMIVPAQPRVGGQVIVMAVSRVAHEQVLLLGPGGPLLDVSRAPFGDRYIWQATLVPDRAGEHVFVFGVSADAAPLTTCADTRAMVAEDETAGALPVEPPAVLPADPQAAPADGEAQPPLLPIATSVLIAGLNSFGQTGALSSDRDAASDAQPAPAGAVAGPASGPTPTRTPRPTRTPSHRAETSNANQNGNENDNAADPTPTKTRTPTTPTSTGVPTATRTPTPTKTPRPDPTDTPVPLATEDVPPTATRTPRPDPTDTPVPDTPVPDTRTPTPTRTPRPDPTDTPLPTATRTPTPTRTPRPDPTDTPVPTPTPTLEPPAILDWTPSVARCRETLTIRGQRFGIGRKEVDGRVLIDGTEASIIAWEMTRIEVTVPWSEDHAGNDRELLVIVAGKTARATGMGIRC
jgi:hypothetical protein